jgi:hypothetical protein
METHVTGVVLCQKFQGVRSQPGSIHREDPLELPHPRTSCGKSSSGSDPYLTQEVAVEKAAKPQSIFPTSLHFCAVSLLTTAAENLSFYGTHLIFTQPVRTNPPHQKSERRRGGSAALQSLGNLVIGVLVSWQNGARAVFPWDKHLGGGAILSSGLTAKNSWADAPAMIELRQRLV